MMFNFPIQGSERREEEVKPKERWENRDGSTKKKHKATSGEHDRLYVFCISVNKGGTLDLQQ